MSDAVGMLIHLTCCSDRPDSKLTVSLQVLHICRAFLA